ncbi:hypothetical protein AB3R30_17795 [Leptolyngbyaceae cyanobacterium UHCC 1019]
MSEADQWFVVKQENGQCAIAPVLSTGNLEEHSAESESSTESEAAEQWGPFTSQSEAISRRVGLIRAGKCKPA